MTFDVLDFISGQTTATSSKYNSLDRYRDFRKVFLETEEGKRVLREILCWAKLLMVTSAGKPIDPLELAKREGHKELGCKLLSTIYIEPAPKPDRAVNKP